MELKLKGGTQMVFKLDDQWQQLAEADGEERLHFHKVLRVAFGATHLCPSCKIAFDAIESFEKLENDLEEGEAGSVRCPKCSSEQVEMLSGLEYYENGAGKVSS